MSRQAKDPALSVLAVELKTLKFSDAPDLEEVVHERFVELARTQGEYPFRLVYRMPDFKTWVVRLYLSGSVRVIGYSARLCDACRYADMAALRFWKYRVRGASEPVDANLNFDLMQAKIDSVEETDAIWLLDKIENYLKASGVLGDPSASEAERQKSRKARDARRTVRSDFHALIGQLSDKIDALAKKIDQLSHPISFRYDYSKPNPNWVDACEMCQMPLKDCRCSPGRDFGAQSRPPDSLPLDPGIDKFVPRASDNSPVIDMPRSIDSGTIRYVQSRPPNVVEKVIAQVATLENLFSHPPIDKPTPP